MKADGAYVPLDPLAPAARHSYVLRDCGVRVLVTWPEKGAALTEVLVEAPAVECLIGLPERDGWKTHAVSWDEVLQAPTGAPGLRTLTEQDLAYILYASGSTGVPMGIMHAEGLEVVPGEHLAVAGTAEANADAVVGLLRDGRRRRDMAAAARDLVRHKYDVDVVMPLMMEVVERVRGAAPSRQTGPREEASERGTPGLR